MMIWGVSRKLVVDCVALMFKWIGALGCFSGFGGLGCLNGLDDFSGMGGLGYSSGLFYRKHCAVPCSKPLGTIGKCNNSHAP